MAITREELKIGETYIELDCKVNRTILCIGELEVFYKYNSGSVFKENSISIANFIEGNSIVPNPKIKKRYLTLKPNIPIYGIGGDKLGNIVFEVISDEMIEVDE